jgi:hypothetical protein
VTFRHPNDHADDDRHDVSDRNSRRPAAKAKSTAVTSKWPHHVALPAEKVPGLKNSEGESGAQLPELSNFSRLPGRAGGSPWLLDTE